ncbi:MAG: hypothetical protein IT385_23415 [Deltaproteobacteria bacterium]|nr:hypothetical protein [Deltaproteobacteria bacterium]
MTRWWQAFGAGVAVLAAGLGAEARAQDPKAEALRVLQSFASEPTVVEVQNAASSYARVNPGAYDSWLTEAQLANLLPRRVQARVRSTADEGKDLRTTSAATGSISDLVSEDDELQLELRLEWDLTRLVFNRDGIAAARQIERIVNQREDILTTVNKLYFARRQLQVELAIEPPSSLDRAVKAQLRIQGLTADLDALTGGWFSKRLAAKGVQ